MGGRLPLITAFHRLLVTSVLPTKIGRHSRGWIRPLAWSDCSHVPFIGGRIELRPFPYRVEPRGVSTARRQGLRRYVHTLVRAYFAASIPSMLTSANPPNINTGAAGCDMSDVLLGTNRRLKQAAR